jgi:hypothetical protein
VNLWRHLLVDGEYAERSRILDGLRIDQVSTLAPGALHSIYQELWHVTHWQSIVLSADASRRAAWIPGKRYPATVAPAQPHEFDDLAREFLAGLETATRQAQDDDALAAEVADGVTLRDELACLAVHNAYHLAKIVTLRQQLGCWNRRT